jgi:hypothetical protein
MSRAIHQAEGLFDAALADDRPPALPYIHADPAAADAALTGADGYRWLSAVLPTPEPVHCEIHGVPMALDEVPLLFVCPRCSADASAPSVAVAA